ncbi:MAG: hypothetical protein LBQ80_01970 [Clostridium sp.]|jgi:hypothetical protein|nr:hypothetical protein [Clostridium sp.]
METLTLIPLQPDAPPKMREAQELHYAIIEGGKRVAESLLEFAAHLKEMRDRALYVELGKGYGTFEQYLNAAVGLRPAQAYNYIQCLERLGENEFRQYSHLGITKMHLLSELTAPERYELMESCGAEEMSVKELKDTIAKLRTVEEQLTLWQDKAQSLEDELAAAKGATVQVMEPDEETIARAIAEKVQELERRKLAEIEAAKKEAKLKAEKAQKDAAAAEAKLKAQEESAKRDEQVSNRYKEQRDAALTAVEKLQAEIETLKAARQPAASTESPAIGEATEQAEPSYLTNVFKQRFNAAQAAMSAMLDLIGQAKGAAPETAEKFRAALRKLGQIIMERTEVENEQA